MIIIVRFDFWIKEKYSKPRVTLFLYRSFLFRGQVPTYSFVGNEKFDVPANSQRDYHAVFHSYEKWNFHFKVTRLKFYISTGFLVKILF